VTAPGFQQIAFVITTQASSNNGDWSKFKQLQDENGRLKWLVAELTLDRTIAPGRAGQNNNFDALVASPGVEPAA
jgi:hypothetical protein